MWWSNRDSDIAVRGYCNHCRKVIYLTREAAKKIGKRMNPHRGAYRCPADEQFWHLGRLTVAVRHGEAGRESMR